MNKKIILVVGRTASGKSSIVKALCDKYNLKQVVSYTTRPMRNTEKDGSDHIFITADDVAKYKNDMAAYTKIGLYEYFATYDILDQSVFYVIDPAGVKNLLETCCSRYDLTVVYVASSLENRREHAHRRGDSVETLFDRNTAEDKQFSDFERAKAWDHIITNNGLFEEAVAEMEHVLNEVGILPSGKEACL